MKAQQTRIASVVAMTLGSFWSLAHAAAPVSAAGNSDATGPASSTSNEGESLETVIVTGIRASLERSLNEKRDSNSVMDVVSAENDRVALRGTSPSLTQTLSL